MRIPSYQKVKIFTMPDHEEFYSLGSAGSRPSNLDCCQYPASEEHRREILNNNNNSVDL
jgi:hypothetical protein